MMRKSNGESISKDLNQLNELNRDNELNAENDLNTENELNPEDEEASKNEEMGGRKEKEKSAPVWQHFLAKDSDGINFAHCNYCNSKYKVSGKCNSSTGNMRSHMKKKHPDKWTENPDPLEEKFEFTQERYREALVKFILLSDQPFTVCEEDAFLDMVKTLNSEAITISKETVKRDIMAKFEEKMKEIKSKLAKAPGRLSFTLDAWTSKNTLPFLAIRAHWISSEWIYETVLLDFCHIEGSHGGANLCKLFIDCLKRYDIPLSKVLAVTMDNAKPNDSFMECLQKHGIKVDTDISAAENRIRCMPHILNLSVQDILASLKIPLNYEDDKYKHLDEQDNEDALVVDEGMDEDDEEEDEEEGENDEAKEKDNPNNLGTVPKLRKLIKKIRKSTQMRQKLRKMCQLYGIKYLTPIIDVATRWNSTFLMIERATYLKIALRGLCSTEKKLSSLAMKEVEFVQLNLLNALLHKFNHSTKLMSMERHPTISAYLPTLNWLSESLKKFISDNPGTLAGAAEKGLEKLQKYEQLLDIKNSKLPYVATFLNPSLKMSYFKEHNYNKTSVKEIQKSICDMFEKGYKNAAANEENEEQEPEDEFFEHMHKRAKLNREPKEIQKYMQFQLSSNKVNVLDFWRSQSNEFPRLGNSVDRNLAKASLEQFNNF